MDLLQEVNIEMIVALSGIIYGFVAHNRINYLHFRISKLEKEISKDA